MASVSTGTVRIQDTLSAVRTAIEEYVGGFTRLRVVHRMFPFLRRWGSRRVEAVEPYDGSCPSQTPSSPSSLSAQGSQRQDCPPRAADYELALIVLLVVSDVLRVARPAEIEIELLVSQLSSLPQPVLRDLLAILDVWEGSFGEILFAARLIAGGDAGCDGSTRYRGRDLSPEQVNEIARVLGMLTREFSAQCSPEGVSS